jgi:hypothetical protein
MSTNEDTYKGTKAQTGVNKLLCISHTGIEWALQIGILDDKFFFFFFFFFAVLGLELRSFTLSHYSTSSFL